MTVYGVVVAGSELLQNRRLRADGRQRVGFHQAGGFHSPVNASQFAA